MYKLLITAVMSDLPSVGISAQVGVLTEEHYSAIEEARVKISDCECGRVLSHLVGFLFILI